MIENRAIDIDRPIVVLPLNKKNYRYSTLEGDFDGQPDNEHTARRLAARLIERANEFTRLRLCDCDMEVSVVM